MIDHHVFLRGGIGNQFFQWVYAKNLQQKGFHVKLNTTFLRVRKKNQTSGQLELNNLFSSVEVPIGSWKYLNLLEYVLKRLGELFKILEDDHNIECKMQSSRYFHYGYYQTDKFVNASIINAAKDLLHNDLKTCDIAGSFCVLHVRAGDYLTNAYNFKHMGLLSTEYHVRAGQYLLNKYPNNKLIIVSDNEQISGLVLNALKEEYSDQVNLLSTVLGRAEGQIDAIKTMLSAQAISLSNSSFSAMCAIVGNASDVLYPRPWFRSPDLNHVSPVLNHWTMQAADFSSSHSPPP
jgi:hypothetical protein